MAKKTQSVDSICAKAKKDFQIVGRESELKKLALLLSAERNVLIEGPVGVGKTVIAQAIANAMGRPVIRIDGDSRFSEQKLTGWFDPATALKKGFNKNSFIPGPLVEAMEKGAILFVNEMNRMPEAVQNVLLPAIDERHVQIPQLGTIKAKEGFLLIATQNPREFVATSHLSEALMDRMEWLSLGYQGFEEEKEIVVNAVPRLAKAEESRWLGVSVALVRATRSCAKIKRGASIRAAIAIAKILAQKLEDKGALDDNDFLEAALLVLPTRIELVSAEDGSLEAHVKQVIQELLVEVKKNS